MFRTRSLLFDVNARCGQGLPPGFAIDPRTSFYYQMPKFFTSDTRRRWRPKQRGSKQIGRMYTVSFATAPRLFILLLTAKEKFLLKVCEQLKVVYMAHLRMQRKQLECWMMTLPTARVLRKLFSIRHQR